MKKVKLIFWILVVIFLGLLIWQNQAYFFTKYSLGLNLYFSNRVTPEVYNLVFIAIFFASGLLLAYISSLFERFKANKTIKELRSVNKTHQDTIDQMRREVDALKTSASPPGALEGSQTENVPSMTEEAAGETPESETPAQPSQP